MGGIPLTNFPVMIRFMGATADLNLRTFANGGHVENSNGYDIILHTDVMSGSEWMVEFDRSHFIWI